MTGFLVVLDVDSTLIEDEVIELLAARAGSLPEVADITSRAMNGELDFSASLAERVKTLAGLPSSVFTDVRAQITLTRGVPELVASVHRAGGKIGVVSGGFHEIIDPMAQTLGLDYWRANRLEIRDDALTGLTSGPVIDGDAKATALREWAADCGVPMHATIAIGDGANDITMMAIAGLSIGFDAKAPVRDAAHVLIDRRDLAEAIPLLGLVRGH